MADFHTLPLELSDMVCDFADGHYGVSKNLRLAAKFFYARATKNVFKTLVVGHSGVLTFCPEHADLEILGIS